MIEVTDEMVQLALDRFLATPTDTIAQIDEGMRDALAVVLALVERDYELIPYCNAELMPGVVCRLSGVLGHSEHRAKMPTGSTVTWS